MITKVQPKIERTIYDMLVVRIFNIPVNHDLPWRDAVRAAGPETNTDPLFDTSIWNVEDKYPTTETGIEIIPCLSLLGFYGYVARTWKAKEGAALSEKFGLPHMGPHHAFAIGIEYPQLNRDLGRGYFAAIAFQTIYNDYHYEHSAPGVSWLLDKHSAGMHCMRGLFYQHEYVGLLGEVPIVS